MLEAIINPKKSEHGPWKMFFVGLIYASLSLLLVHWFFSNDPDLSKASGMIVITFCIMFSLPYMYYIIKYEERDDEEIRGNNIFNVWRIHQKAVYAFIWLFLGFIIAFSFWHIVLQDNNLLNFQLNTYCRINSPGNVEDCVLKYSPEGSSATGMAVKQAKLVSIIENNMYVMIFSLIFSLIFGAGAIFILIWNASVIAAAIGIFTKYSLVQIPLGVGRYMIHGVPEIGAYFIAALAGGIFGIDILRNGFKSEKFVKVFEHVIMLLFIAIVLVIVGAIIEVYVTPNLFR